MRKPTLTIRKAKTLLRDNESLMELAEVLLAEGYDRRTVARLLAEAGDDAIDWTKVVQGPAGVALESIDFAALHAAALLLMPVIERKVAQAREAVQERVESARE